MNTHFFDAKHVSIFPGNEEDVLMEIASWKQSHEDLNCTLSVDVSGFGEMDEIEFRKRLKEICDEIEIVNEYKNASNVLDHTLYKRFVEKIDETEGLDVAGPVRLTKELGESATSGFRYSVGTGLVSFFQILSFLSVAIAFMNLLPIPALDGGQLLLTFWEAVRRKPIKAKVIFRLQIAGFLIVLALLVVAIFSDIIFIVDEIKR